MSIDTLRQAGFDTKETNHAGAILSRDFNSEFSVLTKILINTTIECTELLQSGGNKSSITKRLGETLREAGWRKRNIKVSKLINGRKESIMSSQKPLGTPIFMLCSDLAYSSAILRKIRQVNYSE